MAGWTLIISSSRERVQSCMIKLLSCKVSGDLITQHSWSKISPLPPWMSQVSVPPGPHCNPHVGVFPAPRRMGRGGGGCKRSTMPSEPAASCFLLFCVGTWLPACPPHCSQTCMSDVHKSTAALDHAGCRCAFEAPNWNSQVFSSSHTGLSFKHTHTHTHTSSARSTAVCASVRAGIVKCVLRVLVWSGIMLICPWWRHSHQRLHTIVRRDGQRGRKGRSQGVEKTSGREVNLW